MDWSQKLKLSLNKNFVYFWDYVLSCPRDAWVQVENKLSLNVWGHCCSVAQLCLTLCDPMGCSPPGSPVLHCLPELAQTCVHRVSGQWTYTAVPQTPGLGSCWDHGAACPCLPPQFPCPCEMCLCVLSGRECGLISGEKKSWHLDVKWRNSWERWGWLQWKRFSDKLVVTHPYKHVTRDLHLEEKCRASTFLVLLVTHSDLECSESSLACFWQTFRVKHLPSSESPKAAGRRSLAPTTGLQDSPDLPPDCPLRSFHSLGTFYRGRPWLLLTLIGVRNGFLRSRRGINSLQSVFSKFCSSLVSELPEKPFKLSAGRDFWLRCYSSQAD